MFSTPPCAGAGDVPFQRSRDRFRVIEVHGHAGYSYQQCRSLKATSANAVSTLALAVHKKYFTTAVGVVCGCVPGVKCVLAGQQVAMECKTETLQCRWASAGASNLARLYRGCLGLGPGALVHIDTLHLSGADVNLLGLPQVDAMQPPSAILTYSPTIRSYFHSSTYLLVLQHNSIESVCLIYTAALW